MTSTVLFIGSRPGEIEWNAAGFAALCRESNASVHFVSVTDGSKSHYERKYVQDPDALARRRYHEAKTSSEIIGAEYELMGLPECEVFVNLANSEEMIRILRNTGPEGKGPDIVVTSRLGVGDRDQRYCSQLVHDAFSMLRVGSMCADTPCLERIPVLAYWGDDYVQGGAFQPDVRIDITPVIDKKCEMIASYESVVFEWMPWIKGMPKLPPENEEGRIAFVRSLLEEEQSKRYRAFDKAEDHPDPLRFVEWYQISEYGSCAVPDDFTAIYGNHSNDS
jgi:LmbE family N-acetylglucosaminyl deacetylase